MGILLFHLFACVLLAWEWNAKASDRVVSDEANGMNAPEVLSSSLFTRSPCSFNPSLGISLLRGLVVFLLSFFFQITPSPEANCLHPSSCVLLIPEVFVSFETSSSLPFPHQAPCSSDLLQHSCLCHPFTFFVSYILFPPPLIHQFLPSTTLPLYPFHIGFCWSPF